MADNVTVDNNTLTDYVVASDDDGTAQHQYTKVEFGPDNTQTKVTASVGLPVNPVQETAGVGVGAAADAEAASGSGSAISVLKRLRTLLGGGLPAALSSNSALKVEQVVAGPTQPVSGTVAATQSGTWTVQPGNTANTTAWKVDGSAVTQPVSGTVTVQDGGGAVSVDDNGGSLTVDGSVTVSGSVTADTELTTADLDTGAGTDTRAVVGLVIAKSGGAANISNTDPVPVSDAGGSLTVDGTVTATPTGTYTTKETRAATSALTTVADNAASTSILASNANRLKAVITNDSSARLYLRFEAAAASTSNYMVSLAQNETWEENLYTGEIRGIWATDPNDGAARVTEFTA